MPVLWWNFSNLLNDNLEVVKLESLAAKYAKIFGKGQPR
jgi:hypothetical protein